MSESYLIPACSLMVEEEIKHSRFISLLFHCESEQALKCALTNAKSEYPGANHYCYAFIAADPDNTVAMGASDDGEPAGSAGRPMLATLQGAKIGEIAAIVVRYFGGTKLGVGGLVRAYSSGIKQGLVQLETQIKLLRYPGQLLCDYHQLKDVEHYLAQCEALITDKQFSDNVSIKFEIPKAHQEQLQLELATLSKGQLKANFSQP
ncbi:YigZ family protein [Shewanella colwelliana]|uniref:YigZ family protein n=1 Tax=Shewanella colwelliana TaxID=23 RepID=A0A1E5IU75_SHECO|nr:YigZ family protein [Shewanella colwelliana]OEG74036.1 YigZ family protein [Shewanella colwelliana]